MDKIFMPDSKHWIYPPYPYEASQQRQSETSVENVEADGVAEVSASDVISIEDSSLGIKSEFVACHSSGDLDHAYASVPEVNIDDSRTVAKTSLKLEPLYEFESVPGEIVNTDDHEPVEDEVESIAGCSRDWKLVVSSSPIVSQSIERTSLQDTSTDICPPVKRPRKRKKIVAEPEEPVENEVNSGATWEEQVKVSLAMTEGEFNEFVESQGFDDKSPKLQSLFDFGVPEPKSMPRFATKIPEDYFKFSNALRVYQNILKPSSTYGSLIINATDQAFYKPDSADNIKRSAWSHTVDPNDTIITVECYHPSTPVGNDFSVDLRNTKLPAVAVKVEVLGSQTLVDLQTKLHCENDFVYIAEIEHPHEARKLDWHNCASVYDNTTFQTATFFINDTLYTWSVTPNYGQIISKWAGQKLLGNSEKLKTRPMKTKLNELSFRPGYPYLYRHTGCEHLLVFTNVRTLHPEDHKLLSMYPRVLTIHNLPLIRCRVNSAHTAKFVVKNNPLLPEPVVPMCTDCCLKFCYTTSSRSRGKDVKVGSFQLYPLIQKSMLPISNITM